MALLTIIIMEAGAGMSIVMPELYLQFQGLRIPCTIVQLPV